MYCISPLAALADLFVLDLPQPVITIPHNKALLHRHCLSVADALDNNNEAQFTCDLPLSALHEVGTIDCSVRNFTVLLKIRLFFQQS
jgi:hypothetical protein